MSMMMRRAAFRPMFRASRPMRSTGVNTGATEAATQEQRDLSKQRLQQGARRDPELYVSHISGRSVSGTVRRD